MPARFSGIKFNLMRAIEIFQDLNHHDMEVMAPPSGRDYFKEIQVANKLNDYLGQLIDEGLFDDCDLIDAGSSEEESEIYDGELSTPESEGFNMHGSDSDERASKESYAKRFKRYIGRLLPRGQRSREDEDGGLDFSDTSGGSQTSGSLSRSGSRRSGNGSQASISYVRNQEHSDGLRRHRHYGSLVEAQDSLDHHRSVSGSNRSLSDRRRSISGSASHNSASGSSRSVTGSGRSMSGSGRSVSGSRRSSGTRSGNSNSGRRSGRR